MSAGVSPTDRIRGEMDALFDGWRELAKIIEDVARLGARLIGREVVDDVPAGDYPGRRLPRRLSVASRLGSWAAAE